jgi:hypothetical protein
MSEYGYVCVSNSKKDFKARVIKFVTRSNWSHSFLTAPDMLGHQMALESAGGGVSLCPFDKHYRNDDTQGYRVYRFKVTQEMKDEAISTLINELETSYGWLELPWFAWRALNKFFGRDIRRQNNWSKIGTICSELVAQYISMCGHAYLFGQFGDGSVNAQDVYEICELNKVLFELVESKD